MNLPENVKNYFWLLLMMTAFGAVSAFMNKYVGNAPVVPAPPTITVTPVVAVPEADGTMRILNLQPVSPAKK